MIAPLSSKKMSQLLTCITCGVGFRDGDIQRKHYKSDWHRYNLKRKIAGFDSVAADVFHQLVLDQRAVQENSERSNSKYCNACHKSFIGDKSFQNHLASNKHREKAEKAAVQPENEVEHVPCQKPLNKSIDFHDDSDIETDSEIEELSSDEWNEEDDNNPINRNDCLFCSHHSRNLSLNIKHMTEAHSFFVPDVEYCVDLKGFLLYLGEKIYEGHLCLWCGEAGKSFISVQAVQKHMIDKGHTKVLHEGDCLLEYSDYFDYSTSYPDADQHDADDDVEVPVLNDSDYQLTLPSGATIGHRSLLRYYKQNLDPKKGIVLRSKIQQVLSSYRLQGYTPLEKEAARRKARDIKYMRRAQQKFYSQVGVKANKLQRHFRPQVDF